MKSRDYHVISRFVFVYICLCLIFPSIGRAQRFTAYPGRYEDPASSDYITTVINAASTDGAEWGDDPTYIVFYPSWNHGSTGPDPDDTLCWLFDYVSSLGDPVWWKGEFDTDYLCDQIYIQFHGCDNNDGWADIFVGQYKADLIYEENPDYSYDTKDLTSLGITVDSINFSTNGAVRIQNRPAGGDVSIDYIAKSISPEKADNPHPSDTAIDILLTYRLEWTCYDNYFTDSFKVYFGTDPTPDSTEYKGNQTGKYYHVSNLDPGTTYYWRIDSVNPFGIKTGDVWSFTTKHSPEEPNNCYPEDEEIGVSIDTFLSWDPAMYADHYKVVLTCACCVCPDPVEVVYDPHYDTYVDPDLEYGRIYEWYVEAHNNVGLTEGCRGTFTVENILPGQAHTPTPADGDPGVDKDLAYLEWVKGENAIYSDIYFGTNPVPGPSEFQWRTAGTTDLVYGSLEYDTPYYWRIDSVNGDFITEGEVWSFTTGTLNVLSPNGGEVIQGNTIYPIEWETYGPISSVDIEYSTNNGADWAPVSPPNSGNSGSYSWTVPLMDIQLDECLVRVSDAYDPMANDISDDLFTILGPLHVLDPNGGELIDCGMTYTIEWETLGGAAISDVLIDYSIDDGNSWLPVDIGSIPNTGSYEWLVPLMDEDEEESLIRISDYADPCVYDTSDKVFKIRAADLNITVPNGGERLLVEDPYTIEWTTIGIVDEVVIEYSTNGGFDWNPVTPGSIANEGYYEWEVPNTPSNNCLIKIYNPSHPLTLDISDDVFQIYSLRLLWPTGGENLTAAVTHTITWETKGDPGDVPLVNVRYSLDSGLHWYSVVPPNSGNDGAYDWIVPEMETDTCRIKIIDGSNPGNWDVSDNFNIIFPVLTLLSPNGGEDYTCGTTPTITWNTFGIVNDVIVEYSINNGLTWSEVSPANSGNSGSYSWLVWTRSSDECLVRVRSGGGVFTSDTSDDVFICRATFEVLDPDGGEDILTGPDKMYPILWETIGIIDNVTIDYGYQVCDGTTYVSIESLTENTEYYEWSLPIFNSHQCLIRLSDPNSALSISNISDDYFTIYECQEEVDLDGDCLVGVEDLRILADFWLSEDCIDPNLCTIVDFDLSSYIDLYDFSYLSHHWLIFCGSPYDPIYDYCPTPWPECWNYPTQCHGDATGDAFVDQTDLDLLTESWQHHRPLPCYNICADFDHDGVVNQNDLNILVAYWEILPPPLGPGIPEDCQRGDLWPQPEGPCGLPPWQICVDNDADGFGAPPNSTCCSELLDCNDFDPTIYPGAPEICDGLDNDCDSIIDNKDFDEDGHIDEACGGDDCDDNDPNIYAGAPEVCNGIDDDCDDIIDNKDADEDGHIDEACGGDDCDDSDEDRYPGNPEVCDGVDNDCDDIIDNKDADEDDYIDEACGGDDCDDSDEDVNPAMDEICGNGKDDDCDGTAENKDADEDSYIDEACGGDDCDDSDEDVNPGVNEICGNGIDDDCDGIAENKDLDSDLHIDEACAGGDDCDDTNSDVYTGAPEICDGLDNDCDDIIDNTGVAEICDNDIDDDCDTFIDCDDSDCGCSDLDGDDYGDPANVCCLYEEWDCDDSDPDVNPGMEEICGNGKDDDCDGTADNRDFDEDGYIDELCGGDDCNDVNQDIYPGAPELCDGLDNDCDDIIDNPSPEVCDNGLDDDCDGYIDCDDLDDNCDLDPYCDCPCNPDIDRDGDVDGDDIDAFQACYMLYCPEADLNCDGHVWPNDLSILLNIWACLGLDPEDPEASAPVGDGIACCLMVRP
ncbi:MAG: hypothetical protein JW860_07545 [Sedimentisphaerales bacterium]|nr:hypothetical protein [Sedimentisphaerales bacterium]